ncbi:U1 snRNP protein [Tilletia horrida]|uniref:U1 snRNP protein n=1 Tax=Tilletia horrida TaxID=155126 RepID=A0AAN6GPR8_9BASI|nr:U1 snRNP protein [Tilletia horrida]KAK0550449.1 U1 snRNP protein [Tilletia horrida]KAK0564119.1 U1 snRNP protein [Tilletia horrida]
MSGPPAPPGPPPAAPGAPPGPPPGLPSLRLPPAGVHGLPPPPAGASGSIASTSAASDIAFPNKEDAERAFIDLLRSKGVDLKWSWEQTMRAIVTEPMYRALKTLAERKNAFGKYLRELEEAEEKEKRDRMDKLLPLWRELAQTHGKNPDGSGEAKVKVYTSFDTAEKWFSGHKQWSAAASRDEAKELYAIIQKELRDKEEAFNREIRHRNMDMLMSLFKTFEADVFTTWADAQRTALSSEEFQSDEHLSSMDPTDMLIVWEEHMKSVEKEESDRLKKASDEVQTKARKNRKAFVELLQELKKNGTIKAGTEWSTVYKLIENDDRLVQMLGQSGSTPLELFYDVVDELDAALDEQITVVEAALAKKGFKTTDVLPAPAEGGESKEISTLEGFERVLAGEHTLSKAELEQCFNELVSRADHEQSRARARAERRLRHAIDDLRYELKRVDFTPEEIEQPYEAILAKLEAESPEFRAEKDEAVRRGAWEKFVRRHKEKLEERKNERRDSGHRDRPRDRDRDARDHSEEYSSRKRKDVPPSGAGGPGSATDSPRDRRHRSSRSRSPERGMSGRRGDRDRAARRSGV